MSNITLEIVIQTTNYLIEPYLKTILNEAQSKKIAIRYSYFKNFPKKLQKKSFLKRMMEDHKEKYTHDYPIFKQKMSYNIK